MKSKPSPGCTYSNKKGGLAVSARLNKALQRCRDCQTFPKMLIRKYRICSHMVTHKSFSKLHKLRFNEMENVENGSGNGSLLFSSKLASPHKLKWTFGNRDVMDVSRDCEGRPRVVIKWSGPCSVNLGKPWPLSNKQHSQKLCGWVVSQWLIHQKINQNLPSHVTF